MKLAKRLLALSLAVLMVLSFVGCGGNKTTDNGEIVTLRILMGFSNQPDTEMVLAEANKIAEKEIGARLEIEWIDGAAYPQQMKMNMASGDDYDICFTGYSNKYLDAVNNGGLYDITELVEANKDLKKGVPDYVWDMATVEGKIYGVPNVQGFSPKRAVIIQKKYADKYNLDVDSIKTMDDLEPFFEQVKQGETDVWAFSPQYGTSPWVQNYVDDIAAGISISADADKDNHEVFFKLDMPVYRHAYEIQHEWFKKGYIRPDIISAPEDNSQNAKYVARGNSWLPGSDATAAKEGNIIIPVSNSFLTKTLGLATLLSVGANSKHPEKAVAMIGLLNTNKEFYNLIINGIEGVHYDVLEDGTIRQKEDSGYKPNVDWAFGNQFNAFVKEGQDLDVWEQTKKLNDEAIKSPLLQFTFDSEPVKTEISQISAVNEEFHFYQFVVEGLGGELEANYRAKLEAAGLEKVKAEVQKQVDAFFDAQ